jgi:two-component system, OmpR family, response regulator MtrA
MGAPLRVVVADDDPMLRDLLVANLEADGHDVWSAVDGVTALELVRVVKPDLVLLDVTMPGADGITVLQALRADPETAPLPVVLLTARASESDQWAGWQAGADSYVTKPVPFEQLAALIVELTG